MEGFDNRTGRSCAAEGLEEESNAFLNLFFRIQHRLVVGVVDEGYWKGTWQLAAAGFV